VVVGGGRRRGATLAPAEAEAGTTTPTPTPMAVAALLALMLKAQGSLAFVSAMGRDSHTCITPRPSVRVRRTYHPPAAS
jgi:hypothetical protein